MSGERRPGPVRGFNQSLIEDFRANQGQITQGLSTGRSLLLLTTKGRKTGAERTNPVAYTRDRDRYVVVASKGGERRRLYDAHAARMPAFKEYEQKTRREIPVVVLERAG
jgi:hypothetical protein